MLNTNPTHQPLRRQRAIQALILAALGVFFLQKIWSGTLYWYINDRFFLLVLFGAAGFLALAHIVSGLRLRRNASEAGQADVDRHQEHDHDHHDSTHSHDHDHSHSISPWALLIVALPVILGVLVPARPLGSSAIANKGLNAVAPLTTGAGAAPVRLELDPSQRTVLDWVRMFNYEADPQVFAGQPADVIGFVFHDSRLGGNQFFAGRFTVSCCVADAAGIAVVVESAQAAALPDNTWVRVQGPIQVTDVGGQAVPLIVAETIAEVPEPSQPYLYP